MTDAPPLVAGTAGPTSDTALINFMQSARKVLAAGGLGELGERAWSQVTTPVSAPTLVVVGEIKRGKSSLVNALLARPGASPVDVDIATSAFVRFVPPEGSVAPGQTELLFAGGRREPIAIADLPDWITVTGRHVTDPTNEELPIGAEVALGSPFLPRLTLVDTPGVGGLNPNHVKRTTTATTTANMLLMVCDATAPITAPELSFLKQVSAEVNSVMIAVTKMDKNFAHWQAIVAENRRLLREHAPRFAAIPMMGVSSVGAVSALRMDPGERRDAALRASGLPTLIKRINQVSAHGETLAAANGLRAVRTGLERLAKQSELRRSAMVGDLTPAGLDDEKKRLQALRQEWEGGWRDYMARDLNNVQRNALAVLDHKLEDLKARWRAKLDSEKLEILRRAPQLVVADMTADLEVLVGEVSDEYIHAIQQLVNGLQINAEISVEALHSGVRDAGRPRKRGEGAFDPMMAGSSIGIGYMGIRLLLGGAAAMVVNPVGLAVGAAVGGVYVALNYGFRAIKMGRQGHEQWLAMTTNAVSKDVSREIAERGDAIRPVIVNGYKQYLTESMDELKNLIATAETAAKASQAQRTSGLAEIDAKLKMLRAHIAAADAHLTALTTMASTPPAAVSPSPS
ncbi:MAG: dynamin family protein [Mycobacterium sp.]|nr:dynamin family protein [Mycobacterium sp.]